MLTLRNIGLLFICLLQGQVTAAGFSMTAANSNVIGAKGSSASLVWYLDKTSIDNLNIITFRSSKDNYILDLTTGKDGIEASKFEAKSKTFLGSRLEARYSAGTGPDGRDVYTLVISNLSYADALTYQGTAIDPVYNTKKEFIKLTVQGGPEICGNDLPQTKVVAAGNSSSFVVDACGYPQPTILWSMGNVAKGAGSNTNLSSYKFRYAYDTEVLTKDACGEILKYDISGKGNPITKSTTLMVTFTPEAVKITKVSSFKESGKINDNICVSLEWSSVAAGKCEVIYQIQLFNGSNSKPLHTAQVTAVAPWNYCNVTLTESMKVQLWAVVTGNTGIKMALKSIPYTTTPPPTTAPTTASACPTGQSIDQVSKKCSINPTPAPQSITTYIVIGAVVGVILIVLLCCVCWVCCHGLAEKLLCCCECCKPLACLCLLDRCFGKNSGKKHSGNQISRDNSASDLPLTHHVETAQPRGAEVVYADAESVRPPVKGHAKVDMTDPGLLYADLGPGGRQGPREPVEQSDYAEVSTDQYGNAIVGDVNAGPPKAPRRAPPQQSQKAPQPSQKRPAPRKYDDDSNTVDVNAGPPKPSYKSRAAARKYEDDDANDEPGMIV